MDKNKSLNEIIEAINLERGKQPINPTNLITSLKIPLLPPQKQKKVDYSKLFSYFSGKVKENPYFNYESEKPIKKFLNDRKTKKLINYEEIVNVVKVSKMDRLIGRSPDFINPKLKEKFDNFKIFNKQYIMLLYQLVDL